MKCVCLFFVKLHFVTCASYITLNGGILNDELERSWTEVVMSGHKIPFHYFPGGAEKTGRFWL
jgi:hypothetical protein